MYSSKDSKPQGDVRTLSRSQHTSRSPESEAKTAEENRRRKLARMAAQKARRAVTHHKARIDPEEQRRERLRKMDKVRRSMYRTIKLREFKRRMAKMRPHKKGSIRMRRGASDHDPLQTARYDRLILDSGSGVYGAGYFDEEKGEFVPDTHLEGIFDPVDMGPIIPGDAYVRDGRSRFPGTDIRRYDQLPSDPAKRDQCLGEDQIWGAWGSQEATDAQAKDTFTRVKKETE